MRSLRSFIGTLSVILILSVPLFAQHNNNGDLLLTANGVTNPEYSSYKSAPVLKTKGTYYPEPAFAARIRQLGEIGSLNKPTSFATGILTNGDYSTDVSHRPMPYVYWADQAKASLNFDLGEDYTVTKVRVNLLNRSGYGAQRLGIYTEDELLESGQQPMEEITPQNGWNEFIVNKDTRKIKLEFTRQENARFIGVSEVEIWGKPIENKTLSSESKVTSLITGKQRAFDFGPADSPLLDGFTPVDIKTLYSKERGYGWIPYANGIRQGEQNRGFTVAPGLMERDRGAGKIWRNSVPKDDLYRDFIGVSRPYTQEITQEFAVDLPSGKYQIYLASGDLIYGHPGKKSFIVTAEGKQVLDSLTYDADFRAHASFDVNVTDGQLNLRFSDNDATFQQGWTLDGLLILPINNATEKEAASTTVQNLEHVLKEQQDNTQLTNFTFFDYPETNRLFFLSPKQTDQGYLLFVRDWMRMVYPNTIPLKSEVENANITVAAAPGEYAPASVGIYPLKSTFKAAVEVSDLFSRNQQKINKNAISVRITGYMPERIKREPKVAGNYTYYVADSSVGTDVMNNVPKILYPYKSTFVVNETKQIWLTFHVPETAKPGIYQGTITIKLEGLPQQTLPISLTVYPFQLLQSDRIQGVYWLPEDLASAKLELKDMAEHGIRAVTLSGQVLPDFKNENGQIKIDFSRLDALIKLMKDAGVTGYIPFSTGSLRTTLGDFLQVNPDIKAKVTSGKAYQIAISQLYQHAKENDWPEVLFYPVDEIGNSQGARDSLKYLSGLIREAAPGSKIYTTVNNYSAGLECMNYFDYATVNVPFTKEQEQTFINAGKRYMRYGNSYNFNPRISRTLSGFGLWQRPAIAMYYYHYRIFQGDPMNPLDGTARDMVLSYPSPDGPINSIDFEAIRQGNNDLRYIRTMQVWMEKAKQQHKDLAAIKGGEAILAEITNSNPSYNQYDLEGVPNEKYHEWRSRMAHVIEELQRDVH